MGQVVRFGSGAPAGGSAPAGGVLRIDCAACVLEGTAACADCVVTFVVDREPGPLRLTGAEAGTLAALARGGLAPVLRHRPRRPA